MRHFAGSLSGMACVLVGVIVWAGGSGDGQGISRQDAIEIARKEVAKRGYESEDITIEADDANTEWKQFLKSSPGALEKYQRIIGSKRYWAVYVGRKRAPNMLKGGGDAFVLIDANNGMVIDIIRFK